MVIALLIVNWVALGFFSAGHYGVVNPKCSGGSLILTIVLGPLYLAGILGEFWANNPLRKNRCIFVVDGKEFTNAQHSLVGYTITRVDDYSGNKIKLFLEWVKNPEEIKNEKI